jgi:hypothetical protein
MVRKPLSAQTVVDAAETAGAAAYLAVGGGPDLNSRGPARPVSSRAVSPCTGTPAMPSDDAPLERSGRPRRLLGVAVAALGALFAAALFSVLFDHGLPHRPARAEAAAPIAAVSSAPSLYFHGPGGEFLDFAPAGSATPERAGRGEADGGAGRRLTMDGVSRPTAMGRAPAQAPLRPAPVPARDFR